jgi:hypothetical protein
VSLPQVIAAVGVFVANDTNDQFNPFRLKNRKRREEREEM